MTRTAKQIVDQTHDLAEHFYLMMGYKHKRSEHGNLYVSEHPTEQMVWNMACYAQEVFTDTNPNDALSELDEEKEEG